MSAIAAQLASLPITKHQPAMNPHHGPELGAAVGVRAAEVGYAAASWADDVALQNATTAAITSPISSPVPATAAAGAKAENTPAPIMDPRPMKTASASPRRRTSAGGVDTCRLYGDLMAVA